jgi:hypothetical protein
MATKKITYRQMIAEFLSFLKENNALRGYQIAVRKQKLNCFNTIENKINIFSIEPLKRLFCCKEHYSGLVDKSFTWDKTEEGHAYWEKLDSKWRRRVRNKQIEIVNEKIYEK